MTASLVRISAYEAISGMVYYRNSSELGIITLIWAYQIKLSIALIQTLCVLTVSNESHSYAGFCWIYAGLVCTAYP